MADRSGTGLFPNDTPITEMGLNEEEVGLLSNDAKELTKAHLVTLRNVTKQYRSQGEDKVIEVFDQMTGLSLTVGDIDSVAHAFDHLSDRMNTGGAALAGDACCCCSCCPCCTCTASVVIDATC